MHVIVNYLCVTRVTVCDSSYVHITLLMLQYRVIVIWSSGSVSVILLKSQSYSRLGFLVTLDTPNWYVRLWKNLH